MLPATGFDSQKAAEQSNKFMTQMRTDEPVLALCVTKSAVTLPAGLAGNLESLQKYPAQLPQNRGNDHCLAEKGAFWLIAS